MNIVIFRYREADTLMKASHPKSISHVRMSNIFHRSLIWQLSYKKKLEGETIFFFFFTKNENETILPRKCLYDCFPNTQFLKLYSDGYVLIHKFFILILEHLLMIIDSPDPHKSKYAENTLSYFSFLKYFHIFPF